MAIAIGALTVLLGAGGVFMPDWVKDHILEKWEAYSILGFLILLIFLCLVILQIDVRKAELKAEQREKTRENEAAEAKLRELALAEDLGKIRVHSEHLESDLKDLRARDERREKREIEQVGLLFDWLQRDIREMEKHEGTNKKRIDATKDAALYFLESIQARQKQVKIENARRRHRFGPPGDAGLPFDDEEGFQHPSAPAGDYHPPSPEALADRGFQALRAILDEDRSGEKTRPS